MGVTIYTVHMKLNSIFTRAIILASLPLLASAAIADTLKPGDKAPSLKFSTWSQGNPTKEFKSGQVYVVEFWATWCGPCKTSIPHLNELAKKYKDKVTVIGASVWESDETTPDDIKEFISIMGDKMTYSVAIDTKDGFMATNWMEAAKANGIPTAFIVNQKGQVAWIGHPMDMDEPLEKVVANSWDIEAAKKAAELAAAKEAELEKFYTALDPLLSEEKYPEIVALIDNTLKQQPTLNKDLLPLKAEMLMMYDEVKSQKLIAEMVDGILKDDEMSLNYMAWLIVDPEVERKSPDYKLAVKAAKRANELTKGENADILDTYARCLFMNGDKKLAIETQEKAVKIASSTQDYDEDMLAELKNRLAEYKKG